MTRASFRLMGRDGLTAEAVTSFLGVEPSDSFEAGERISKRATTVREGSGWFLDSGDIEDGVELAKQFERVLVHLEPVEARLWQLVERGYWANWFCYVASSPLEHAVELDRPLLTRLLRLPGEVWLDVCGEPTGE